MPSQHLVDDLRTSGYDASLVVSSGAEFIVFDYLIPVGGLIGQTVRIGLQAPDWPVNPPGGVMVSPRIQHPGDDAHHASPLGADWIYWSRPFPDWAVGTRTLDEYLTHLRTLFFQFPVTAEDRPDESAA
ncbi:hypothetical protein [Nocardioides rubriscoriae]|uniref:hypothetical protein n=1 Tax=Nocardioides rubriscoriae TaxID=642762 RepID=UPI0011DFFAD2|nr:hypothetical protein [Nocardioides rubriscoriae]